MTGLTLDEGLSDLASKFNVTMEVSPLSHPDQISPTRPRTGYRAPNPAYCRRDERKRPQDRLYLHERCVESALQIDN